MNARKSIMIAGVGSIGERHLRCFAASGRADISFCEVNPTLRQIVTERYHVAKAFDSLDAALASKPDAVVICTPAHLHVPMALTAAKAGVHLLIEKPLSTGIQGVADLQKEITAKCLIAGVAYVYRAHPALTAMREALRSGRFGAPVQLTATCGQNFPHYRPAYRDTYYRDHAMGGGAVQDALTHIINAAEWLVGPVNRLVADVDHQLLTGVTVEDTVHVLTRHQKVMGSFTLNQHQAPNETTITIACERGTLRFEAHRCRWSWITESGNEWHNEPAGPLERDDLFKIQASKFLDALTPGLELLCPLADAIQSLRVNLAILSSAEKGGWESLTGTNSVHTL
jgi:predicted dehydrogenase